MEASPEGAAEKQAKIVGIRTPVFSLAVAVDVYFIVHYIIVLIGKARLGLTMVSG